MFYHFHSLKAALSISWPGYFVWTRSQCMLCNTCICFPPNMAG